MNAERLPAERHGLHRYTRMPPTPEPEPKGEASSASLVRWPKVLAASASVAFRLPEAARVFEELPCAAIVSVPRPDTGDITPMLLSYTIEVNYKQITLHGEDPDPLYVEQQERKDKELKSNKRERIRS